MLSKKQANTLKTSQANGAQQPLAEAGHQAVGVVHIVVLVAVALPVNNNHNVFPVMVVVEQGAVCVGLNLANGSTNALASGAAGCAGS